MTGQKSLESYWIHPVFRQTAEWKWKNETKERQLIGSCKRTEKVEEHEGDLDIGNIWFAMNIIKGLGKKTVKVRNPWKNRDLNDLSIVEID